MQHYNNTPSFLKKLYSKAGIICFLIQALLVSQGLGQTTTNAINSLEQESLDDLNGKYHFTSINLGLKRTELLLSKHLEKALTHIDGSTSTLQQDHLVSSPLGKHYTWSQYIDGSRVYHAQVKAHIDLEGRLRSFYDFTFNPSLIQEGEFPILTSLPKYSQIKPEWKVESEKVWFFDNGVLFPALQLTIQEADHIYYEEVYDNTGKLLYYHNLVTFFGMDKDSTASALVFLPDPLTSAGVIYGPPFIDDNDADIPQLNAQRKKVEIRLEYDEMSNLFILESPEVQIVNTSEPNDLPVTSSINEFHFKRSEQGFEDVNVFYHIQTYKDHINDLGYSSLVDYSIRADPHAFNGADQSNFSPVNPIPVLSFGEGGVDDAEDADVIVHEYGHAIVFSAAPNTNAGTERQTLDEAMGDYLAASYSRSLNPHNWQNVFSWDGHNTFWSGRIAKGPDHYPEDLKHDIHTDAVIWSASLMQIWAKIGRTKADKLALQTMYGFALHMSMPDAAELYLQADALIYNGENKDVICNIFFNRGLVSMCDTIFIPPTPTVSEPEFELWNLENFAAGNEPAELRLTQNESSTLRLIDPSGRTIWSKEYEAGTYIETPPWDHLAPGIYLLQMNNSATSSIIKIMKLQRAQ